MNKAVQLKDNQGNNCYPSPYFPVGSIYLSVSNVNPSTYFGGTWQQIKDKFLLCAGDTYSAGTTGGKSSHYHLLPLAKDYNNTQIWSICNSDNNYYASFSGGGKYHSQGSDFTSWAGKQMIARETSNMPPYLAVYVWQRTA